MTVTFEQARDILAEDLDAEGDGRTVAAWGWENDEVFVLAFDLPYESIPENVSDDPEREAALGVPPMEPTTHFKSPADAQDGTTRRAVPRKSQ